MDLTALELEPTNAEFIEIALDKSLVLGNIFRQPISLLKEVNG
jgi:hypothetical protein